MAQVLKMPRLSDTMVEGVLVSWRKKEGDAVEPGDVLAEVETDKATMELESFDSGILKKVLLKEGQGVPVGGAVAIIAEDADEDISGLLADLSGGGEGAGAAEKGAPASAAHASKSGPAAPEAGPASRAPESVSAPAAPPAGEGGDGRLKASPLARKIAAENQLPLQSISGSGPGGRIVKRDIERALVAGPAPAPAPRPAVAAEAAPVAAPRAAQAGEQVPLSQMRKTIARRMTEAKQSVPHFYLTSEIDMGQAMALRQQLNEAAGGSVKISVNDLVVKACAAALVRHPRINASFEGDSVFVPAAVHLGIAVAMEDGLITPTIRDCQEKSIGQIAREARELAERAVAKKLRPDEFSGATFTVSNLGMYGIVEFVAIINPPQSAILAVGATREIPVVEGGQLTVGKRMRVTLSCDHRVIDGAQGAQFLATLKETLENPLRLLL